MTALEHTKPTLPLSLDDVRDRIKSIVRDNPDRVARCKYVVADRPECIVGVLLFNMDVPLANLREMDAGSTGITDDNVPEFIRNAFQSDAIEYLGDLQHYQDNGHTWYGAREFAELRI